MQLPHEKDKLAELDENQLRAAIMERRMTIRYIRDQRGDDRCWYDFYLLGDLVEGGWTRPTARLPYEVAMNRCRSFYAYCRLEVVELPPPDAILDPVLWDADLASAERLQLLEKLAQLQAEILKFMQVQTPISVAHVQALVRLLPEKLPGDYRLPPESEFLGDAKAGAGCPNFWRSHALCTVPCDLHRWGPCPAT